MMEFLNIFPKSPSLPCGSDGLFEHFLKKSITSMSKVSNFFNVSNFHVSVMDFLEIFQKVHHFHVSVMDFLNIFPKSPSLPCVSDGLFKHFSKKFITSMRK